MRTAFDGDCFVDDVAMNLVGGRQTYFHTTHAADHTAVDDNIIGHHFARNDGGFTYGQKMGVNVAIDFAFNLNVACGFQVARDVQVGGQHRCRWFWFCGCGWC